ncbi:hypothetical protein J6S88_03125 [bacterium]|nr:hypothetical protein [bacterium]
MELTFSTQKSNTGTCPHGLPIGACPICNGMGGGLKKADFSAKPGEMSWNECAAIGAFLRAQKLAKQTQKQDYLNSLQRSAEFYKKIDLIQNNIRAFTLIMSTKMPKIISAPVNFIINTFVQKPLSFIRAIPQNITNIMNKISDVTSKITSVLGELKNAMLKKTSEKFNDFKKKIKSLFGIFSPTDTKNDDKKIQEDKKIFNIKNFINKILRKKKNA